MKTFIYLTLLIATFSLGGGFASAQVGGVMPQGFADITLGMSTNQLMSVHTNIQVRVTDIPSYEIREFLRTNAFFDVVGYALGVNNLLELATFFPVLEKGSKAQTLPGFLKGCIEKYGTNYVMRVHESNENPAPKLVWAMLTWTFGQTNVVATFLSDANSVAQIAAGGQSTDLHRYDLRIYLSSAISGNYTNGVLDDVATSVPASQDMTGRAFTNFPAFLDSYAGPIWQ